MSRILLVEDDIDVRLVLEHVLLDAGHEVESTETVEGGCALLCCRSYDLVLTDGRLRDGTGMIVADRAAERGVPTLIVTGYAFNLDGPTTDLSKYRVIEKPVRPSALLDAVSQVLNPPG